MKTKQLLWESDTGWEVYEETQEVDPQLVLFFGGKEVLGSGTAFTELSSMFPNAQIVGCSTAGEIIGEEVLDDSIVATAIQFENTVLEVSSVNINEVNNSFEAGKKLGESLNRDDLATILIISDGHSVNGTDLVRGTTDSVSENVVITGGLAGDGPRFEETLVSANGEATSGTIAAIGLYGENVLVGHGSVGGWDSFGPERVITRSEGNVLYELDGQPALELYKKYLGENAKGLPGSALQFPLSIWSKDQKTAVGTTRTILSINEEDGSMTFAGDMPEGYRAQLMMATFDKLIDGAASAARSANTDPLADATGDKLAVMVSCVGRKLVMGQRTADEVEAVKSILGEDTAQMGFYSYGEISPHEESGFCELHNQTMTITYIAEKE